MSTPERGRGTALATVVSCLLICLLPVTLPASADAAGRRRVVMVVIDRVSPDELSRAEFSHLADLVANGTLGLVGARNGERDPAAAYATLGAGTHVALGGFSASALEVAERCGGTPAGLLYSRRLGSSPGRATIVFPTWPELVHAARTGAAGGLPGGLGEALRRRAHPVALVGSADRPGEQGRWAGLLVVDGQGTIEAGRLDGFVVPRPDGPFGVGTDWDELLTATREALMHCAVVVVETGETLRADAYASRCTPGRGAELKREALRQTDLFVGRLLAELDPTSDLLILVSPGPRGGSTAAMSPLVLRGPGFQAGLAWSPTTRWPGIVSPVDLAPTVLEFLDELPPAGMTGRPLRVDATARPVTTWLALAERVASSEVRRAPLLKGYVLGQIVAVAAVLVSLWLSVPLGSLLQPVLLALTVAPLVLLLLGAWPTGSPATSAGALVAFTAMASLWLHRRGRGGPEPFVAVSLTTVLVLVVDVLTGYRLTRFSPLGYSPVSGFRFYGLGNELVGVYVGACLVGLTGLAEVSLRDRLRLPALTVAMGLALAVPASGRLGANLGGALSAAVAFSWTLASLTRNIHPVRRLAVAAAAGTAAVLLAAALDAVGQPPSLRSHLGMAGHQVLERGLGVLVPTLERKVSLNLRLIRYTIWSRVFLSSLAGFALLFHRPPGLVRRLLARYPALARGFTGVLLAALVALVANDSGIVAAATTMIYATATLGYLTLGELARPH